MSTCSHDGFHSGIGRYLPEQAQMRYVMVCDRCGSELGEVHVQAYRPEFDPAGNDGSPQVAA